MRKSTLLDAAVQDALTKVQSAPDKAGTVAQLIADSPEVTQAIKTGMSIVIPPDIIGLSRAQLISDAIIEALKQPK